MDYYLLYGSIITSSQVVLAKEGSEPLLPHERAHENVGGTFVFIVHEVAQGELQGVNPDWILQVELVEDDLHLVVVLNWLVDVRFILGVNLKPKQRPRHV